MSDAQKLIADVHAAHAMRYDEYADDAALMFTCLCGVNFPWSYQDPSEAVDRAHAEHVAAEIDKALGGLTREKRVIPDQTITIGTPLRRQARWVSGWSEVRDAIGTVVVTAHPSPADYDKQSEFTLEDFGGMRQDFTMAAGVHVRRQAASDE